MFECMNCRETLLLAYSANNSMATKNINQQIPLICNWNTSWMLVKLDVTTFPESSSGFHGKIKCINDSVLVSVLLGSTRTVFPN